MKNILFDLGGVILDIDVNATLSRFFEMGFPATLLNYPENMNTDLFYRYETGKIGTAEFRDEIRQHFQVKMTNEAFDEAWNSMIVQIPAERAKLIESLGKHYGLYMLSNTSPLHVEVYEKMYVEVAGRSVHEAFDKVYYSYEIGSHKPDLEAWEFVLRDAGIKAEETLFLDDNIHNIKASQELGFQAIHIHESIGLMDLGFDL